MNVRLTHYDSRWKQEFQQTRSSILQSCLGWITAVEHVGSTAIPGLIAQPTIDILAGVNGSLDSHEDPIQKSADFIEGLNFRRHRSPSWAGESVLLHKPRHGAPTHCVILMDQTSKVWRQALAVRDHLIDNADLATRFEQVKVARWRSGQGDPKLYKRDKSIFFTHVIDQIGDRR